MSQIRVYGYVLKLEGFGKRYDGVYGELVSRAGVPFYQPVDQPYDAPFYHSNSVSLYYSTSGPDSAKAVTNNAYAVGGQLRLPGKLAEHSLDWGEVCGGAGSAGNCSGATHGEVAVTWHGQTYYIPGPLESGLIYQAPDGNATLTVAIKEADRPGERRVTGTVLYIFDKNPAGKVIRSWRVTMSHVGHTMRCP